MGSNAQRLATEFEIAWSRFPSFLIERSDVYSTYTNRMMAVHGGFLAGAGRAEESCGFSSLAVARK